MKFHNNGDDNFVITSNDILVNGNQSSILTDVINSQDNKLNNLEKNVKWLYKYGGVGSKGSGGSTYKFKVDATVLFGNNIVKDTKSIKDQKIILSDVSKGYETLSISLGSGNVLDVYNVKISHGGTNINNPATSNSIWSLNNENDFTITLNIPLDQTGTITIDINGTSGLTHDVDNHKYIFTYITNPYIIELSLISNNGYNMLNNDNLYVNDAIYNGVNLNVDYNITSSKQISYEISNDEDMLTTYSGVINDSEHGVGLGSLTIPFNTEFLVDTNNYGYHTINIKFKIDPDESLGILNGQIITKNISYTYIPNEQIFFKLEPINSVAKIYKYSQNGYENAVLAFTKYKKYYKYFTDLENEKTIDSEERAQLINEIVDDASIRNTITDKQLKDILNEKLNEIESDIYLFNVGTLQLYIEAYNGSNVLGSIDVSYIASTNVNETNGVQLLSSLQYRKRQMINIPIHDEGVYKLCIYSTAQREDIRISYYLVAINKNDGLNWFEPEVINNINGIDFYYREGKIGSHTPLSQKLKRTEGDIVTLIDETEYIRQHENKQRIQKYANGQPSQLFDISNLIASSSFTGKSQCDIMISFGIQYSYINDKDNKILSILANDSSSRLNIDLYQDKITGYLSTTEYAKIFMPKEHKYAPGNIDNYHLLTLYKRYIYTTTVPYYEIIIYLDGCQEGAFKSFIGDSSCWTKVLLNNANYSINFFELAYLTHDGQSKPRFERNESSNTINTYNITYLDDTAVSEYYYKYVSSRKNLSSIISLLDNFKHFKETSYGMIEVASMNDINAIANGINVPTLMFTYTEQSDNEFVNWFTKSYKENSLNKDEKKLTKLYYSSGLNNLSSIELPEQLQGSYWFVKLQGSSTGELFSKNLTLGINNKTVGYKGVFTPNFYDIENSKFTNYDNLSTEEKNEVIKAKNSFLPESSFTLKADVVDSTHSNNTAVGAFVNANTKKFDIKFDNGTTNASTNKYVNYIKNCLLGFPVLIFANVIRNGKSVYYYLGIYNFNLGRDSYFNMGYYSPGVLMQSQIVSTLTGLTGNSFAVTYVDINSEQGSSLSVDNGVIVAEIQGGDDRYDFSQYHSTILLPQKLSQGEDTKSMFGDFVPDYDPAGVTEEDLRIRYHIPRLVEAVAKAGGYLFQTILKKHLGEYKYGYNKYINRGVGSSIFDSANQVPNYLLQYVRNPQESDKDLVYLIHNFVKENGQIKLENNQPIIDPSYIANESDIGRLIDANSDADNIDQYGRGDQPILDYSSLTEYYVTCMAFGLVDSVMKNLNVKTWNATYTGDISQDSKNGKWYVAFYDMDTSFGRDNGGKDVSYFAFSDYWKTNKISDLEVPTIYRDFYPKAWENDPNVSGQSLSEAGFDIPSSYLFAVAKYSHLVLRDNSYSNMIPFIPHNIWARWRYTYSEAAAEILGPGLGELKSADYFIQKYFIRNLDDIPEQLWSLNYRFKYLKRITTGTTYNYTYDESEGASFENINYIPFHGKGINRLQEWLAGRFHILDAYFNLDGNNTLKFKYLEYKEKESEEPLQKFIPIIKLDELKGYEYVDTEVPTTDSLGSYKWLDINDNAIEYIPGGSNYASVIGNLTRNDDIKLLKDIFATSGNGARYTQPINLYVRAQEFSPLMIQEAQGSQDKYLLEDPDKTYHIYYNPHGAQITKFGGSSLWTYVKDFNTVISDETLTLNSDALDQIILTKGRCKDYNIQNMKSLKTISIVKDLYDNESKFTGELKFINDSGEDPYPDLTTIQLIRTEIQLTVDGEGVINIDLSNTQTPGFATNITNCTNLENVTLTNFNALSLKITPGWSNDMLVKSTKVKQMEFAPKNKEALERKIEIKDDEVLEHVILDGFTDITIRNCPNLYNVCILEPENVKSLNIISCNVNQDNNYNLNIYYDRITTYDNQGLPIIPSNKPVINPNGTEDIIIDLTRLTNLESFKFDGTLGFNVIDVSTVDGKNININGEDYNCIKLYSNAFSSTSLEKIITKPNTYLYIDSDNDNGTTETFANSGYGMYRNKFIIGKNVRKLNSLFSHNLSGANYSNANINGGFVVDFLNCNPDLVIFENIDNIKSLAYLFYGQVSVTLNISSDNLRPVSLHRFKNVNDISYLFFGTSIYTFNSSIFGNETEYCGMNTIALGEEFILNNFIPTSCSIDLHVFDFYINNVKNLMSDNMSIKYDLNFTGYVENSIVHIEDLFTTLDYDNNKLESFLGLSFNKTIGIDWSNLLYDYNLNKVKFPHLQMIKESFCSDNIYNTNYNFIGLNKFNINELELFDSFNYSIKSIERLVIDEIINFETLSNNNPRLPWHESINSLNGAKQINEINIIPLLELLKAKKCTSLNGLFENTNIVVDTSKQNINELILSSDNVEYNFTSCINLFNSAKFVDPILTDEKDNPIIYGFEITQNTLKAFKKVINWSKAFYKCTLHKNLPLNMFNLKNSWGDYIIDNYQTVIEDLTSMFESVKIDSNETWFNYNWTEEDINKYNKGIQLNGSYNYLISIQDGVVLTNPKCKDVYEENFKNIYGEHIIHNLVLPWDIFYGCTSSCRINSFIASSDFEGILPSKLFPQLSKISRLNIINTFYNVLIIPNYFNDIIFEYEKEGTTFYVNAPAYVFVPEYFSTQSTYLINGLSFKLLLPKSGSLNKSPYNTSNMTINNDGIVELYFVIQDNSINFGSVSSIRSFLPKDNEIVEYDKITFEPKHISLHDIDVSITENSLLIDSGNEVSFNARRDNNIHYYMYLNKELFDLDDPNYPWVTEEITKIIDGESTTVSIFKSMSKNNTDTGLPLLNYTNLLYEPIFNDDIISFCYGPILTTSLNLGNMQQQSGSSPFIDISGIWSDFSYNLILPLNEINGAACYENVFNANVYTKTLSLHNIYRNSQQSLENYVNSNKFINKG